MDIAALRADIVGHQAVVEGPRGPHVMVYADWFATGRALSSIERYILEEVLPYYGNTHSTTSTVARRTMALLEEARSEVLGFVGGHDDTDAAVFVGSGATGGLNKLVRILRVGSEDLVLTGPYEHHSNLLPWREAGARMMTVPLDVDRLRLLLAGIRAVAPKRRIIGAFSAGSNVTGILTDVPGVAAALHEAGALAVVDAAAAACHQPLDMSGLDALVFSPHKFLGGPGTPGVLILKRRLSDPFRPPTDPGGGTVVYVSSTDRWYRPDFLREEAGTPPIVGAIRAGLALRLHQEVGWETIQRREKGIWRRLAALGALEGVEVLGATQTAPERAPVVSLTVDGLHYGLVTQVLDDFWGVQARAGCDCAGPYGHALLEVGPKSARDCARRVLEGDERARPGWTRLSLHYTSSKQEVSRVVAAVEDVASRVLEYTTRYRYSAPTWIYSPPP